MKLNVGDSLYEPISDNNGEVIQITNHPDGKLVNIRWRVEGHLHHDTEHVYAKVIKSIKSGDIQHTPISET